MKKIALLMALLVLVFSLCACGGETENPETTAQSVPETGETAGEISETIPTGEHDYVKEVLSEADCITAGMVKYTCRDCEAGYTEEIPALGHEPSGASCTDAGVCTRCGEVAEAPWGHVDQNGVCKNCGISMTEVEVTTGATTGETIAATTPAETVAEEITATDATEATTAATTAATTEATTAATEASEPITAE